MKTLQSGKKAWTEKGPEGAKVSLPAFTASSGRAKRARSRINKRLIYIKCFLKTHR